MDQYNGEIGCRCAARGFGLLGALRLQYQRMVKPKTRPRHGARNRLLRRLKTFAITAGALAVIGGIIYGLAISPSIAYNERDLTDVDFTPLNAQQKRAALIEANADRCTCGCGMALAQCVATDMTCPVRDGNITKIRGMVQKALNSGGGS